jgi:nucleotide-binding universal stress UspA family protein
MEPVMELMLAFDNSRNARIALDAVKTLLGPLKPNVTLISVVEDVGSSTGAADDMFREQFAVQKAAAEAAASELMEAGMEARVLLAEGDARKMILRAIEDRKPDLLVLARHSEKPDKRGALSFLTRKIDALVEEFDHMTFGSTSAFLARRANCPLLIVPTHED